MNKVCTKCGIKRSVSDFSKDRYKKDGLQLWCKTCTKIYYEAHKKDRTDYQRKYQRVHKKEAADYNKIYNQVGAAKKAHSACVKKHHLNYPEKLKARSIMVIAVRSGELKKSVFCESCGLPVKTQGHHADYSKPLEVNWLCRVCHNALHIKRREKFLTN